MDVKQALADNKLWGGLSAAERDKLATIARPVEYQPGQTVFRAGEAGDSLFLIASGAVTVVVTEEGGEEAEVAVLQAGSYFGEMEVVEAGMPRTATIIARDPSALLRFDASEMTRLLEADDHLAMLFYRTVCKELVRRLRATTMSMGYYKVRSVSF